MTDPEATPHGADPSPAPGPVTAPELTPAGVRWRLLAAVLALTAGVVAIVIAVLYVRSALG